jgi:hypothetical protein
MPLGRLYQPNDSTSGYRRTTHDHEDSRSGPLGRGRKSRPALSVAVGDHLNEVAVENNRERPNDKHRDTSGQQSDVHDRPQLTNSTMPSAAMAVPTTNPHVRCVAGDPG